MTEDKALVVLHRAWTIIAFIPTMAFAVALGAIIGGIDAAFSVCKAAGRYW